MLDFPRWKQIFYWAIGALAMVAALPSLTSIAGVNWPAALPKPMINLGLDLAGGSHILLEANPDQVRRQRLDTMEEDIRARLRKAEPQIRIGDISTKSGRVDFLLGDPSQIDAAREVLQPLINGRSGARDWDFQVVEGSRITLTPTQTGINQAINQAMDAAVEVVRTRIDKMGTREPTIIREGDQRILVQVPGLKDPKELKEQLNQTAQLEFKLVDMSVTPQDLASGIVPPGSQILTCTEVKSCFGLTNIAVHKLGGIRGDKLTNAQATKDSRSNEDAVSITFDNEGGAKFAKLTTENTGKPFAIILDNKVISAPNINEPILGGTAQITGSFNAKTANQLAISLASGALPVDLKVVEERTVGPDLGADSIRKGMIAFMVGTAALMTFILAMYGRFGVYACLALVVNVLMILGVMASFGGTLTLPGIAGFVLTIGAAVDANVLINERIREERHRGRKVMSAVETGYKEASRAIFDANITNIIAAVLMAKFGTGPIRGFAIVLIIGIATSVFTAVVLTRMWVANWLHKSRPSEIAL